MTSPCCLRFCLSPSTLESPLSLLGNGSINRFPRQRIYTDASYSMQPVSYKKKVGDYFLPELLVSLIRSVKNTALRDRSL
jgi:hypothetical protein